MLRDEVGALVAAGGLDHVPLALSVRAPAGDVDWVQHAALGERFYAASLSKQVTGAAVAVLVQRGLLDVDAPIGAFLPDLPAWRDIVTPRHLLHHLGGLPEPDSLAGPGHWTSAVAMQRLRESPDLVSVPGTAYRYSNAGYICLAGVVEQVSGQLFAGFVRQSLFAPLGLLDLDFTDTPTFPQLAGMGPALPLSLGDGGIWTTASAFAGWLDHQNRDTLGLAALVQQAGRLADGTPTDYGWGIGIRAFRGHPYFIHGGGWPGATAKAVRCPELGIAVAALAAGDSTDQLGELVDRVLELAADAAD